MQSIKDFPYTISEGKKLTIKLSLQTALWSEECLSLHRLTFMLVKTDHSTSEAIPQLTEGPHSVVHQISMQIYIMRNNTAALYFFKTFMYITYHICISVLNHKCLIVNR